MKKKLYLIAGLLTIIAIIVSGCGGTGTGTGTDNGDSALNADTQSNQTLNTLVEGIANKDDQLVTNSISADGVVVDNGIGDPAVLNKSSFLTECKKANSDLQKMFAVTNRVVEQQGSRVIITGEVTSDSGIFNKFPVMLSSTSTTDPLNVDRLLSYAHQGLRGFIRPGSQISLMGYSGTGFNLDLPVGWISFDNSNKDADGNIREFLVAAGKEAALVAGWQQDFYTDPTETLAGNYEELQSKLKQINNGSTDVPRVSNYTYISGGDTSLDGFNAKQLTFAFDYIYMPRFVTITFEKQNDRYCVTRIEFKDSSSPKTQTIKAKAIISDANQDMHVLMYVNDSAAFNSREADSIINSYGIL